MASSTIVTKAGDTQITFQDSPTINGQPIPMSQLSGCSVFFLMSNANSGGTIAIRSPASLSADTNNNGAFSYTPTATDIGTAGKFQQEWELDYPSGKILTFPNNGYNLVKIIADLG